MRRARFLASARAEYLAEVTYYSEVGEELGLRFAKAIEATSAFALSFPQAGTAGISGTRRLLVKDFPFAVVYRPEEEGILIVAITPDSKKPGYWRSRLRER